MKLEYFNTPSPEQLKTELLPKDLPLFLSYNPDFEKLEKARVDYDKYENILVIGHGGSITGFIGIYESLKDIAKKNAYFLQSIDPDYISELKSKLHPENTLVIAVSKSGENSTQLEACLQFIGYKMLLVTQKGNTVDSIHPALNADLFIHPAIGGRYTGFSEVLMLPAILCGLPIKEFFDGGREIHSQFTVENDAWKLASVVWQLEQKGFVDIFMPFYSHYLFAWNLVIVQLCHESFGKNGTGGTYLAFEAPESQHHSNQRFFGGIKNMLGIFVGINKFSNNLITSVPQNIKPISFKSANLGALDGIPLSESMKYELEGTMEDAVSQQIPVIKMEIPERSPKNLGKFLAFWQLYAVYSSLLRNVDPFDQPQVEASKILSFQKRLSYHSK